MQPQCWLFPGEMEWNDKADEMYRFKRCGKGFITEDVLEQNRSEQTIPARSFSSSNKIKSDLIKYSDWSHRAKRESLYIPMPDSYIHALLMYINITIHLLFFYIRWYASAALDLFSPATMDSMHKSSVKDKLRTIKWHVEIMEMNYRQETETCRNKNRLWAWPTYNLIS